MSSSTRTVTAMVCDRCGYAEACENGADQLWGKISIQTRGGSMVNADLCLMCLGSFREWYREKADDDEPDFSEVDDEVLF